MKSNGDFESKNTYTIRIRATDFPGLAYEKSFVITLTDVNEAPEAITLTNSTIAENNAAFATIGSLMSSDPDTGDSFSYALV